MFFHDDATALSRGADAFINPRRTAISTFANVNFENDDSVTAPLVPVIAIFATKGRLYAEFRVKTYYTITNPQRFMLL